VLEWNLRARYVVRDSPGASSARMPSGTPNALQALVRPTHLLMTPVLRSRLRLAVAFIVAYLTTCTLVRFGLLLFNGDSSLVATPSAFARVVGAFALGPIFDAAVSLWWALPAVVLACVCGSGKIGARTFQIGAIALIVVVCGMWGFIFGSEFIFWNEFTSRFNFIAVDYLVYSQEVIGNIRESYNVWPIIAAMSVLAGLIGWCMWRGAQVALNVRTPYTRASAWVMPAFVGVAALCTALLDSDDRAVLRQPQVVQLAGNGVWEFVHAFRANAIDFQSNYATLDSAAAGQAVRDAFASESSHIRLTNSAEMPIQREVLTTGPAREMHVVMVSIESLGAEFVEALGGKPGLTPNLERLGREGLWFSHLYATGTRTVRGLEALTLSVPPTPGLAIPMRPNHRGLFTLGGALKLKGYDPLYIYGGYSYFDNMKSFFAGNGYTVVDRSDIPKEKVDFATIWGVADENLFTKALEEIDTRVASGKRVFAHVMTTSNHRPFTFPAGRIDLASGSGRPGAVKYTDYAIGKFMAEASTRAWFKHTLFILVADHTSIARGRSDLPQERYHIPMVWYAPGVIARGTYDRVMSQIDIAPSIMGWLNVPYRSEFFGRDIFHDTPGNSRFFMTNYQAVGYVQDDVQVELRPKRAVAVLGDSNGVAADTGARAHAVREAIAFYQVAARRFAAVKRQ
jgi:phosphoglycerol transferase MdoB-like AlkP superfamily enzyme